jgi:predicted lipoprotein with Yx(FWY)xxD motif
LLLAACGDNRTAVDSSSNPGSAGASAGKAATRVDPELGMVLSSSSGITLYFSEEEADGTIRCVGRCLEVWLPMEVASEPAAGSEVEGLGVMRRPDDGRNQLTYQGKPLYTFVEDGGPGDTKGENAEDDFNGMHFRWHAAVVGAPAPSGGGTQPTTSDDSGYGGYGG